MKILIATDGSDYSEYAVNEFCRIYPDLTGLQIKILSVREEQYVTTDLFAAPAGYYYQQIDDASEKQSGHFAASAAAIVRGCKSDGDLDITIKITKGIPENEIIEMAETWRADLIVVGSHGSGFWGRMLGSVSEAVIHRAPCSVLVVRKPKAAKEINGKDASKYLLWRE